MRRLLSHVRRQHRRLLLGLCGVVMFALWFGVWVRVLGVKPRGVISPDGRFSLLGFSADGRSLITGHGSGPGSVSRWKELQFWDVETGEELRSYRQGEFRPVSGWSGGFVLIDSRKNPQLCALLDARDYVGRDYVSNDGRTVVLTLAEGPSRPIRQLSVWDVATDTQRFALDNPTHGWASLSADGRMLAYVRKAGEQDQLALVDSVTGEDLQVLEKTRSIPGQIQFSSDGHWLAAGTGSQVEVWNLSTGMCALVFEVTDPLGAFCFSSDGRFLATFHIGGAEEPVVKCWDTATWKLHCLVPAPTLTTQEMSGYFIPNTHRLLVCCSQPPKPEAVQGVMRFLGQSQGQWSSNQLLMLFDVETRSHFFPLTDGNLAFAPDGATIAIQTPSSGFQSIELFDLPPRRPLTLCLLLSALPTLLFTGLLWWRVR
jgi:WD40 repeat protein